MIRLIIATLLLCAVPGMGQMPAGYHDDARCPIRVAHTYAEHDSAMIEGGWQVERAPSSALKWGELMARIDLLEAKLSRAHVVAVVRLRVVPCPILSGTYVAQIASDLLPDGAVVDTCWESITHYEISFELGATDD